ncbi:hypothetical protein ACLOJK_034594 [Asimina triloba]
MLWWLARGIVGTGSWDHGVMEHGRQALLAVRSGMAHMMGVWRVEGQTVMEDGVGRDQGASLLAGRSCLRGRRRLLSGWRTEEIAGWAVMGSAAMAAERKWGRWVFDLFAMCALMLEEDGGIGFSVLSSSFWVAWIDPPDGQLELAAGSNGCRPGEGDGAPKLVLRRCTQICVPANVDFAF